MNQFNDDELRKALQPLTEKYKSLAKRISQGYVDNLPPTFHSSIRKLTVAMNEYQHVLNKTSTYSFSENAFTTQLDSVWNEQIHQLQYVVSNLQKSLQSQTLTQLIEAVNMISINFKDYNDAMNFEVPNYIEKELQQAYETAESINLDMEEETLELDDTLKEQEIASLSFMDKLIIFFNVITLIVSIHSNYQQHEANKIEQERTDKLESIDRRLEIIINYMHDHVENSKDINDDN